MPRFRTHYDHLKVEENASIEDIRAAFKIYFLKFHPGKFSGNKQRAEQVMLIVREAYSILSDPLKRAGYDAWIAENRQEAQQDLSRSAEHNQVQNLEDTFAEQNNPVTSKNPSLWKPAVLVILLVAIAYAGWLAFDREIFQTSVLSNITDSTTEGYGFVFENKCRHPITLVVRYKGLDDDWHIDGWWDVDSGESFYLEDENGNRLTSRGSIWYYYARSTNETNIEWKGKNRFTYDGARLPMIGIEDIEGESEWSTSCD